MGSFRNFELFAKAQFFRFHVIEPHDCFDADMIFACDFPKTITGFDRVKFFFGFDGKRWVGFCGSDHFDGFRGKLREEALQSDLMIIGFRKGLACKSKKNGGGTFSDSIGAWGCEEFFSEVFNSGIIVRIKIEYS